MINTKTRVDICLATYNGGLWINDFLTSLNAQSYEHWRLIVSDDDSQDNTIELIKQHFINMPKKLVIVNRKKIQGGVICNFQDALGASEAQYIYLADQDDVWLPDKLSISLSLMKKIETDSQTPSIIYSDLEVVDEQLKIINTSWWDFISVNPNWTMSFNKILSRNIVPGCSMMLNRSLLEMVLPFPKKVVMHDWWFLLVCLVFGKVGMCNDKLVRYRRHGGAHTYFKKEGIISVLLRQFKGKQLVREEYMQAVLQAQAFEDMFGEKIKALDTGKAKLKILHDYIDSSKSGWWKKRWLLIKNGIRQTTIFRTVKFYLWI